MVPGEIRSLIDGLPVDPSAGYVSSVHLDERLDAARYGISRRLGPIQTFLVTFFLTGLVPAIVAVIEGKAFFSAELPDYPYFGKYFAWPVVFCVLFPAITALYAHFNSTCHETLRRTVADHTLCLKPRAVSWLVKVLLWRKSRIKLSLVAVIALGSYAFYWLVLVVMRPAVWAYGSLFGYSCLFYVILICFGVAVFIVVSFIVDAIHWSWFVRLLVREADREPDGAGRESTAGAAEGDAHGPPRAGDVLLRPRLLHPDQACGLAYFGRTALAIDALVFTLMLLVVVQWVEKWVGNPELSLAQMISTFKAMVVTPVLLFVLLPISFFVPLLPLRESLKRFKGQYTELFRRQYEQLEVLILGHAEDMNQTTNEEISGLRTRVENLHFFHGLIRRIPSWPLDLPTVRRFLVTVILPLIVFILNFFFK